MTQPDELGPPDAQGPAGQAWWRPRDPRLIATDIGAWLLYCPEAHPFWRFWLLSGCSLREFPGVPPATITVPGATHEVAIWSIDPNHRIDIELFRLGTWRGGKPRPLLQPPDLVHQLTLGPDELAEMLLELMVRMMMAGEMSPDSDHRARWEQVLNKVGADLRGGAKS